MERGFVSAIATNGATVIHDFEVALVGATSEDVDEALGPGRFGMADETGRLLNGAINDGVAAGLGIGQSVDAFSRRQAAAVRAQRACWRPRRASTSRSPCTSRSAPTSSTCTRPRRARRSARAACAISATSCRTSRGSSAACISIADRRSCCRKSSSRPSRWLATAGIALAGLTTVNLDFIRSYRPQTNVVARPTAGTGRGYSLVGHHEIMIPLLAAALVERDARDVIQSEVPAGVAQLVKSTRLISAGSTVRVRPPAPTFAPLRGASVGRPREGCPPKLLAPADHSSS